MVKVLECVGEHYEAQDAQRARVYKWCPATVSLQCECGERLPLTSSRTTCFRCGADHVDVIKEVLGIGMEEDVGHSPWGHSPWGHSPWRSLRAYFSRSQGCLFLFVSEAASPSLASVYA
jgi:hypothetical protein